MNDLLKLLDSNAGDVTKGLAGLSHDDLLKLRTAENDGKTRKGVLDALDAAITAADAARAGGVVQMTADSTATDGATDEAARGVEGDAVAQDGETGIGIVADLDHSAKAEIAPAEAIDTAGAPQQIVPDVDMQHPAVDNDPRANTTEDMNRIDFNDPVRSGREVVEDALRIQAGV
jgi:hypothetical protein